MTPVGHVGLGLLGWQIGDRRKTAGTLALFLLAANGADIDFLLSLLFGARPLFVHQAYTHNLLFVLLSCGALSMLLKDGPSRGALLLTGLSHLAFDIFVVDPVPPVGIRLFYPFSGALFNVALFPHVERGAWPALFSSRNLAAVALEFACFVLPVLILFGRRIFSRFSVREFWRA